MVQTKGDVIIDQIQVGDIHREEEYGTVIMVEVVSQPKLEDGFWYWDSKDLATGTIIPYGQAVDCPLYLALNLFNHK